MDYGNMASVRRGNRAVDRMYKLVESLGPSPELIALLEEPGPGRWLAFQLLDRFQVSPAVEQKCLSIIRQRLREADPMDQMGIESWLAAYAERIRKSSP